MTVDLAPLSTPADGVQADVGALVDRAVVFIRSLGLTQVASPTIGNVLAVWRLAERDLESTTPGSVPWNDASERFVLARAEYRRLFDEASATADGLRGSW